MSYSLIPTTNNTGVRNLSLRSGLGGVPCLNGFSTDILTGMIGEGYDPSMLNALFAANASDAQMQTLWDRYGAGTPEFTNAATLLLMQLRGGTGGASSAPGYPTVAQPQPLATGTDFQRSLNLPGGRVGVANVQPPGTIPTGGMYTTPPPPQPIDWSAWLQKNAGMIVLAIAAIAIVPPLVKKL